MGKKRLAILIGIILLLSAISLTLNWRWITGQVLAPGDPEIEQIKHYTQDGNVAAVSALTESPKPDVAIVAADALGDAGPKAIPAIQEVVRDQNRNGYVRRAAVFSLAKAVVKDLLEKNTPPGGDERTVFLAGVAREDSSPEVRAAAVEVLGHLGAYSEVETIFKLMDDPDLTVRKGAYWGFRRLVVEDPYPYRPDMPEKERAAAIAHARWNWYSTDPASMCWGSGVPMILKEPVWRKEIGRFLPK